MITDLGLILEFDNSHSETENLYRQVFGRWPERDCSADGDKILQGYFDLIEHGSALFDFFWTEAKLSEEELAEVCLGLQELRTNFAKELMLLFAESDVTDLTALHLAVVQENLALREQNQELEAELIRYQQESEEKQKSSADSAKTKPATELSMQEKLDIVLWSSDCEDGHKIEGLELPERVEKALLQNGVNTIERLISYDETSLRKLRKIGDGAMRKIRYRLMENRLCLQGDQGHLIVNYPLEHVTKESLLRLPLPRLGDFRLANVQNCFQKLGIREIGDLLNYTYKGLKETLAEVGYEFDCSIFSRLRLFEPWLERCYLYSKYHDHPVLKLKLSDLELSQRTLRILGEMYITTLSELVGKTKRDFWRACSDSSIVADEVIYEIEQALAPHKLGLFPHDPEMKELGLI